MNRQTASNEDWRTDTDDPLINVFRKVMAANIGKQDDPNVGIFWYDPEGQELFGVRSADVNDVPFYKSILVDGPEVKTCSSLHYEIWKRANSRGRDKRFKDDYTSIPRGRVFFVKDKGFVVVVGDWIDDYPEAKDDILFEFNLPEDTEFEKDIHWNIGYKWSDESIKATSTSGLVGIWWILNETVIADLKTLDLGYNDGNFINYDKLKNHATEWRKLIRYYFPDKSEEIINKGYKSLDRGTVVYNLRTQCYEVTCGDSVYNDIEKRKLIIDAFDLKDCRVDFVNLGTHYHVAPLTGNPALDDLEYEYDIVR